MYIYDVYGTNMLNIYKSTVSPMWKRVREDGGSGGGENLINIKTFIYQGVIFLFPLKLRSSPTFGKKQI